MVDEILAEIADEAGWNTDAQLAMCLEYIGRQQDDGTFEDFLRQQLATEREADETSSDPDASDADE